MKAATEIISLRDKKKGAGTAPFFQEKRLLHLGQGNCS